MRICVCYTRTGRTDSMNVGIAVLFLCLALNRKRLASQGLYLYLIITWARYLYMRVGAYLERSWNNRSVGGSRCEEFKAERRSKIRVLRVDKSAVAVVFLTVGICPAPHRSICQADEGKCTTHAQNTHVVKCQTNERLDEQADKRECKT